MPTAVLFRVDADAMVGVGHLQRCLSLASAFARRGAACRFLIAGSEEAERYAARYPFPARVLESGVIGDLQATVGEARAAGCAVVVVDTNATDDGYLREMRDAGFFVCALDDAALHPFSCQLVVNGDAHAPRLRYRSTSGDTHFLLGPRYALLREEFWSMPRREWRRDVRRVLLTVGGGDRHDLTPRLLRMFDHVPGMFDVAAVVGPFFSNQAEIIAAAAQSKRSVQVIHTPAAMRDLMLDADLAITGAGQTLYELACAGCPTVAITIASNQSEQVRAFAEANIAVLAGNAHDPALIETVRSQVASLSGDAAVRREMGYAGLRMVDGQGAPRVAEEVLGREQGQILRSGEKT